MSWSEVVFFLGTAFAFFGADIIEAWRGPRTVIVQCDCDCHDEEDEEPNEKEEAERWPSTLS
jgi:hypothetical protein